MRDTDHFDMYWSYFLSLPILFASRSKGTNDGCITINCNVHCNGISQKELLLSVKYENETGNIRLPYNSLTIVDSNFRHIEEIPTLTAMCYYANTIGRHATLTIRNSGIMRIEPEVLKSWSNLDTLDLSYNEIQNISFLSPLNAVQNFYLSHNRIKYFDLETFAMSGKIEEIDLSFNEITSFSSTVDEIYAISLNLSHNNLTDLQDLLLNFEGLKIIDISYNQLREISTRNFPSVLFLKYLNIGHNKLMSIDSRFSKFLRFDYYTDTNIWATFIFSNNQLKNVDVFLNESFLSKGYDSLDYSNNVLQTINFVKPNYNPVIIKSLKLSNNKIIDLGRFNFIYPSFSIHFLDLRDNNIIYVDLKSFVNIQQSLDLSHNKIRYINSSNSTFPLSLSYFNLSHNEIETLNSSTFSVIPSLEVLDISHCILKHLNGESFFNLSNLKSLNLSFNFIESLPKNLFANLNLKYLDLSHNFLTVLAGNIFSGLNPELIDLGFNQFPRFSENVFNNSSIKNLIARNNPLMRIDEKSFIGLKDLVSIDLSNAGIKELPLNIFENLKSLNYVCLDGNEIESLPVDLFRDQKNLATVSITGNNLTDLNPDAFSGMLQLRTLNITLKGELKQGMFRNLFNLQELSLIESEITTIKNGSFRGLDMLQKLKFDNLNTAKIELGAFIGLSSLKIFNANNWFRSSESVEENQFKGLEKVGHLNLSYFGLNTIKNNAFYGLISLEKLNLSCNFIHSLQINAFHGLKTLSSLDLSRNSLKTMKIGLFKYLINLKSLYLNHNDIITIPPGTFTNLKELQFLNLSNNNLILIEDYDLFPLKKLEVLDVNFNEITEIDYDFKVVPALRTIGIGYNHFRCHFLTKILDSFQKHNICFDKISKLEYYEQNIEGIRCI